MTCRWIGQSCIISLVLQRCRLWPMAKARDKAPSVSPSKLPSVPSRGGCGGGGGGGCSCCGCYCLHPCRHLAVLAATAACPRELHAACERACCARACRAHPHGRHRGCCAETAAPNPAAPSRDGAVVLTSLPPCRSPPFAGNWPVPVVAGALPGETAAHLGKAGSLALNQHLSAVSHRS